VQGKAPPEGDDERTDQRLSRSLIAVKFRTRWRGFLQKLLVLFRRSHRGAHHSRGGGLQPNHLWFAKCARAPRMILTVQLFKLNRIQVHPISNTLQYST